MSNLQKDREKRKGLGSGGGTHGATVRSVRRSFLTLVVCCVLFWPRRNAVDSLQTPYGKIPPVRSPVRTPPATSRLLSLCPAPSAVRSVPLRLDASRGVLSDGAAVNGSRKGQRGSTEHSQAPMGSDDGGADSVDGSDDRPRNNGEPQASNQVANDVSSEEKSIDDIERDLQRIIEQTEEQNLQAEYDKIEYTSAEEYELESKLLRKDLENVKLVRQQVKDELKQLSRRLSPQQRRQRDASARGGAFIGFLASIYAVYIQEVDLQVIEPVILIPVFTVGASITCYASASPRGPVGSFTRTLFGETTLLVQRTIQGTSRTVTDTVSLKTEMSLFRAKEEVVAAPKIARRVVVDAVEDARQSTVKKLTRLRDDVTDFPRYVVYSTGRKLEEGQQRLSEAAQIKAMEVQMQIDETKDTIQRIPEAVTEGTKAIVDDAVEEVIVKPTRLVQEAKVKADQAMQPIKTAIGTTPTKVNDETTTDSNTKSKRQKTVRNSSTMSKSKRPKPTGRTGSRKKSTSVVPPSTPPPDSVTGNNRKSLSILGFGIPNNMSPKARKDDSPSVNAPRKSLSIIPPSFGGNKDTRRDSTKIAKKRPVSAATGTKRDSTPRKSISIVPPLFNTGKRQSTDTPSKASTTTKPKSGRLRDTQQRKSISVIPPLFGKDATQATPRQATGQKANKGVPKNDNRRSAASLNRGVKTQTKDEENQGGSFSLFSFGKPAVAMSDDAGSAKQSGGNKRGDSLRNSFSLRTPKDGKSNSGKAASEKRATPKSKKPTRSVAATTEDAGTRRMSLFGMGKKKGDSSDSNASTESKRTTAGPKNVMGLPKPDKKRGFGNGSARGTLSVTGLKKDRKKGAATANEPGFDKGQKKARPAISIPKSMRK